MPGTVERQQGNTLPIEQFIDGFPTEAEIQQRLSDNAIERNLLRELLKVAKKHPQRPISRLVLQQTSVGGAE